MHNQTRKSCRRVWAGAQRERSALSNIPRGSLVEARGGQSKGSNGARAGVHDRGHQMHHRMILEERYFPAIPRA